MQDLKYENNSVKAVKCLNEMVTNGLIHTKDCLRYMSALKDITILRFCAIPQVYYVFTPQSITNLGWPSKISYARQTRVYGLWLVIFNTI